MLNTTSYSCRHLTRTGQDCGGHHQRRQHQLPTFEWFPSVQGKTVVAITSGANMNFERLRLVAELAEVGATTEATLTTTIPERPGSFL